MGKKQQEEQRRKRPEPSEETIQQYYDWMNQPHTFDTYNEVKKHLAWLSFGAINQLDGIKEINGSVYIASHQIIILDRIREHEIPSQNGLLESATSEGKLLLTDEQFAEVQQEPQLHLQIQLVEKYAAQNKKKLENLVEVQVEEHIEAAVTEIPDDYDFTKDVEF